MPIRDPRDDWRRFAVAAIPSKRATPHLDRFLAERGSAAEARQPPSLLDVGCGDGGLARRMHAMGFSVVGIDVNPAAVRTATELAGGVDSTGRRLRFLEADVAGDASPPIAGGPFDVVVCQLVLSIVGDRHHRANLLRHVRENLRPGGWLYLSASGVSDAINAAYARLYAEDFPLTGERYSYYSRDEDGRILYQTHHFTTAELETLLASAGFEAVEVAVERESSSRRPDEAAFFLYATARRGIGTSSPS